MRQTAVAGAFAVCFLVVIGAFDLMTQRGPIWVGGWGARLAMPALPALFLLAAQAGAAGPRTLLAALIALGVLANLPAVLLNNRRSEQEFRYLQADGILQGYGAAAETWTTGGSPIVLQWKAVGWQLGLGRPPVPATDEARSIREAVDSAPTMTTVPDMWWCYALCRRGTGGHTPAPET